MSGSHAFPHVAQPIEIGGVLSSNRIMMATHGPRLGQPRYLRYLDERARGGVGMAGFNMGPLGLMQFPFGPGRASPSPEGDGVPPHPLTREGQAYYDTLVPTIREWTQAVTRHGVRAVGQLYHPGAAQHSDSFQPVVSAAAISDEFERHRAMPVPEAAIGDMLEAYGLAAARAVRAGCELLELHAAHGYLIQQFLSPLLNRRSDRWGGDLDGRMAFALAALEAVRSAVPDVPVGVRLTGPEPEGGLTLQDVVAIAASLERAGAAYVSVSGGSYSGLWRGVGQAYVPSALSETGPNVATAAAVRSGVSIPVMVSGAIVSLEQAETILSEGSADVVCMVRALMADPALVAKGLAGGKEPLRPCIGGNECHYGRPLACAVNPRAGREADFDNGPAATPRRVLIAGGGPAGMECAVAAAERGHQVLLVERGPRLGGELVRLARVSAQARFGDYVHYTAGRIAALPIEVALGTEFDRKLAERWQPDVLVVATGADWADGIGVPAPQALDRDTASVERVTVIGGRDDHLGPMITADFFAREGKSVTLLIEAASPGEAVEAASRYALLRRLHERGVEIHPFTAATVLTEGSLATRHTLTNQPGTIAEPGLVVDLEGRRADAGAPTRFAGAAAEIHVIGDALSPRRMVHATLEGLRLGAQIE